MLTSPTQQRPIIRESKILHKSLIVHPLARFVTEEAVSLMFNLSYDDIHVIQCWRYVVYIHAKGVSKIVSYADFPPILAVEPPQLSEFIKWRKRWRKHQDITQRKQAPQWWSQFFADEFSQASSELTLYAWGKLVGSIKFALSEERLQELREFYLQQKALFKAQGVTQMSA